MKSSDIEPVSFWSLPIEEVARKVETDKKSGLSVDEARERLVRFGPNSIASSKRAAWLDLALSQLASPLILVLILAGIVTISISHYRDAVFIFIAVVVNAVLGFYQENKAERALSELKTYLRQRARVVRSGVEREIDAEEVVVGDIIRLAQGDRVPADARVVFVNDFQVDEAVLTGESLPVSKEAAPVLLAASLADQDSMVFAGTLVTQGVCTAFVCRTGPATEIGKISELIAAAENEKTPLQKAITHFSLTLSLVLSLLTLLVFVIGLFVGEPPLQMFLTAVAVAVSAIPEGLPISMTVILAVGVERMAKRKGVVRKLVAAEALGSTTVILTDKTGTLTTAKMMLSKLIHFVGSEGKLLSRALINAQVLIENPSGEPAEWRMSGKIMETALVRAAAERGVPHSEIMEKRHVLQTMPFNAVQKFSASLIHEGEKHLIVFFGAPDILLAHAVLEKDEREAIEKRIEELASAGERVLGVATKEVAHPENFSFLKGAPLTHFSFEGIIAFRDPLRPGIRHTIERVSAAGIKTVIMTGDHRGTAVAVALELGIPITEESVLDASELALLSDSELRRRIPHLSVISRVTPFDKLRIVQLFQESGEIVAMTGDGVNDAPSIKQADVGIAMGSGTEVSQSVADLVLLDDNFETIVAAIEEGRQILSNIRKVLVYLLSNVTDGLILIGGSLLLGLPLPLNALQILWVNFFSDSFPAIAFAFEKDDVGLSYRPKSKKLELFDPLMKFLILDIGISTSALLFVLYVLLLNLGYDLALVRTFTFAAFGTYTLLVALSVKSLEKSIFSYSLFSNRYLTGGIGIGFVLMIAAVYFPPLQELFDTVPLPASWAVGVVGVGLLNIVLIEGAKSLFKSSSVR
ncbi:MAG: HAD-IC family P-type ATPase [Patescibacteria group bacterium]